MEEKALKIFIYIIIGLLYFLALYSLISFIFWPKDTLLWYDYVIEIIAYGALATVIFKKKEVLIKKIL